MTPPGADNDLLDATRKLPELQQVASPTLQPLDAGAAQVAAGARVHPPVHARAHRLVPRLRPGDGQLRRQRPLRAHPADLQRLPVHRQPGRRRADARRASNQKFEGLQTGVAKRCPGAASQPAADGSAPFTDNGNLGPDDCDPSLVLPGPMKRVATVTLLLAAGRRRDRSRIGAGDDGGAYKVRAIFDNAGFVIPGEDVKVAGVKVGKIDSLDVTRDFKAVVVLDIQDPAYQDFRTDARCQIRPQSLIGEKFVECTPTQKRAADAEPPPALRQIERGEGEGQYLLPVENTHEVGRPRPDQQRHAPALPPAAVADPHRARHRPRRPRHRAQPGRSAAPTRRSRRSTRSSRSSPRRTRCSPTSRATPTPCSRRSPASASTSPASSSSSSEVAAGDRRARRRPRGRHRAAAALPAGAAADDAPPRRAVRRDDAGARRPRRRRARHQPHGAASSARSRRPASPRSSRSARRARSASRRCATRSRSPRTCGASAKVAKPVGKTAAAGARVLREGPRHRAPARLRLLPGGRHQRLRLVRPLPARAPDPQHLLALLHASRSTAARAASPPRRAQASSATRRRRPPTPTRSSAAPPPRSQGKDPDSVAPAARADRDADSPRAPARATGAKAKAAAGEPPRDPAADARRRQQPSPSDSNANEGEAVLDYLFGKDAG